MLLLRSRNPFNRLVDVSTVMEMILYVRYMMTLTESDEMMRILTDGLVWHAMSF